MPTVEGEIPYPAAGPQRPCVWCGVPTDIRMRPAGHPELGTQPLHLVCTVGLIRAYEQWRSGRAIDARVLRRLRTIAH